METNSGAAYIFEPDVSGVWTETNKLISPIGETDDKFGEAVAILDNIVVIGQGLTIEESMQRAESRLAETAGGIATLFFARK